jgi:hypothetical protein
LTYSLSERGSPDYEGDPAGLLSAGATARTPWPYEVTVLLHLSIEEATQRLPAMLAELVEADDGTCSACA